MIDTLKARGKPHLAQLLSRAKNVSNILTAGVDSKGNMIANFDWLKTLTPRQLEAVLYHEALHIVLKHHPRAKKWGGNLKAYNVAADAHINAHLPDLREIGGVFFDTLPDIGVDPSTLTTEELATALEKHADELPECHDKHDGNEGATSEITDAAREAVSHLSDSTKESIEKAFNTNLIDVGELEPMSEQELAIQKLIGAAWLTPRTETYARPSRRVNRSKLLLRGKASSFKQPIIDLYIDVSGSMADQAPKWVAFGKDLCRRYGGRLRVSLWSDNVPAPSMIIPDNFESGGTNWSELEQLISQPRNPHHKVVVITDLCGCAEGQLINSNLVIEV